MNSLLNYKIIWKIEIDVRKLNKIGFQNWKFCSLEVSNSGLTEC